MTPARLAATRANQKRAVAARMAQAMNHTRTNPLPPALPLRKGVRAKDRLHVSQLLSEAARESRHTPEALRVVGEYTTEFAYLVASLDKESRRKIWSLARRLLSKKEEAKANDESRSEDAHLPSPCDSI